MLSKLCGVLKERNRIEPVISYGVKAIGIGTGGSRMVANVKDQEKVEKIAVMSSWDEISEIIDHVDQVSRVGGKLGGMGCSKDPELGKKIANSIARVIKSEMYKVNVVFGALGGGTFTGYAISTDKMPEVMIISLPKEEEKSKRSLAEKYLPEIIEKSKNIAVLDPELEYPNGELEAKVGDPRFLRVNAFAAIIPEILTKTLETGSWDVGDIKRKFSGIISVVIAKEKHDFTKLEEGWPTKHSLKRAGVDIAVPETPKIAILLTPWNDVYIEAEDADIIKYEGKYGYGIAFYEIVS